MALWSKTKTGFDTLYGWVDKLGPPVNKLTNKLGSEAFWPTTLDKECDKAARILKSFCKDGFYLEEDRPAVDGPNAKSKQRVLKKIPSEVIRNARGLAIFTTMRTGLWVSGAGGSGILIGRKEDGSWSPPSGIMLHTAGLGFLVGVDIYDCVVVINTQTALDAFSKVRCTLGGEISAVAGPVGIGGVVDSEVHKRQAPLFTYLKSRGFYAGVQVDGTIIIERTDANEAFYGERIGVKDILAGKARHPPYEIRKLMETVKAAQGDTDVDQALLPSEPPPGDYEIQETEEKTFGVPTIEDPDPFGVLALETAGFEIREAGTKRRPTSEMFEFHPSPTSPIYNTFRKSADRSSVDARSAMNSRRSSWRTSTISSVLEQPKTPTMVSMGTQTDLEPTTPLSTHAPPLPPRSNRTPSPVLPDIPEMKPIEDLPPSDSEHKETSDDSKRDSKTFLEIELDDEEEPIIAEIQQATAPQTITRARIVQVAKPIPPRLPLRNPQRTRPSVDLDASRNSSSGHSPTIAESPVSTPELKADASSASSVSSVEGLEHVSTQLRPKMSAPKEKHDNFHSLPASPTKTVPRGFN